MTYAQYHANFSLVSDKAQQPPITDKGYADALIERVPNRATRADHLRRGM